MSPVTVMVVADGGPAAGALGVELEKVGHYRLGAGLRLPGAGDVDRSVRLLLLALAVAAVPLGALRIGVATWGHRTVGAASTWGP